MAQQYTLSDIFKHEDTTRQYCLSEGGVDLATPQLIELAGLENHFNSDYVEFIIYKRLHQITKYIWDESTKRGYQINVKENNRIKEDLKNNNASREYYEDWFNRYNSLFNDEDKIYFIIEKAIYDNNWLFSHYLYYKEENELYDLLNKQKNKLNERKFFIIQ